MYCVDQLNEALTTVGYQNQTVSDDNQLSSGIANPTNRQIVQWLIDELCVFGGLDESCISDNNADMFVLELCAVLKELRCPFEAFLMGPVAQRFRTYKSFGALLDYLIDELMIMKMRQQQHKDDNVDTAKIDKSQHGMVIDVAESPAASALRSIVVDLGIDTNAATTATMKSLIVQISAALDETIPKADPNRLSAALFQPTGRLTTDQWQTVAQFQRDLDAEYNLRRDLLLTRLDVTVESFQWSDKHPAAQRTAIARRYALQRSQLEARAAAPSTDVPALLAARDELAIIERTVSATTRTSANIQKHLMGGVPDRGGRALEMTAPPPEMPSWTKRSADGGGGGRGAGGGGGRGGGRGGGGRGGFGRGGGRGGFHSEAKQQRTRW